MVALPLGGSGPPCAFQHLPSLSLRSKSAPGNYHEMGWVCRPRRHLHLVFRRPGGWLISSIQREINSVAYALELVSLE